MLQLAYVGVGNEREGERHWQPMLIGESIDEPYHVCGIIPSVHRWHSLGRHLQLQELVSYVLAAACVGYGNKHAYLHAEWQVDFAPDGTTLTSPVDYHIWNGVHQKDFLSAAALEQARACSLPCLFIAFFSIPSVLRSGS